MGGAACGSLALSGESLKLTIYFGERDRVGRGFLADELIEIYSRHRLQTSLVMRGIEGFGIKHHLHTDRLLTLSEDLPLVAVAVDERPRVEAALADVRRLEFDGLVTLERARLLTGGLDAEPAEGGRHEATKLTVYVGRHERAGTQPAYQAAVDAMRRHGMAGATVLLGVDGTAHGVRRRARLLGANIDVPVMAIAVGDNNAAAGALAELQQLLARPLATLERVQVLKRDGVRLSEPSLLPDADPSGLGMWQKLMVYSGERARSDGLPLHHQVIRSLRAAGASGATSLRGIWGYHADEPPHGDSFWRLRRTVPTVTVVVDTPARIRRWFQVVDEIAQESGIVTSEIVPAFYAVGPGVRRGGLELADTSS